MATNELIEKYRELVKKLDDELENNYGQRRGYQQLRSDIVVLESQAKEPSDKIEYHSCNHPDRYRFIDKAGYQRCASCHGYIEN